MNNKASNWAAEEDLQQHHPLACLGQREVLPRERQEVQGTVRAAPKGGSEASCAATQPDFPGSTSGCPARSRLPVPCSVPAQQQKNPEAMGEPAFGASQPRCREASPRHLPPQQPAHLWAATASFSSSLTPGGASLRSTRTGTCPVPRSGCSSASSHLRLQRSSHAAASVPTHETDAQQLAPTNGRSLPS